VSAGEVAALPSPTREALIEDFVRARRVANDVTPPTPDVAGFVALMRSDRHVSIKETAQRFGLSIGKANHEIRKHGIPGRLPAGDLDGLRAFLIANPDGPDRQHVGERFGVATGTANRIIRELLAAGVIPNRRGAGSYSRKRRPTMTQPVAHAMKSAPSTAPAEKAPATKAAPAFCASLGCVELAARGGTCALHVPMERKKKRAPAGLTPEQRARELAEVVASGKVTRCPEQGPQLWTPRAPLVLDVEPEVTSRREPSMTPEQRRQLDREQREIERRASRIHRGEFATVAPSLVVGLFDAAEVVGIDVDELRSIADGLPGPGRRLEISFRWQSGRRVFERAALEALREQLNEEGDSDIDRPAGVSSDTHSTGNDSI